MQKKLLQDASKFLVRNHRRRSWRKRVGALACAVVVATGSMLTHPAMTLERTAGCGLTEHVHTEECYALSANAGKAVLVCTPERLGLHQHTESCQNESGELICGYSDFVVHQHDDSCYGEDGTLCCPLSEIEVHIHDENCYNTPETGTASEHIHTQECYKMQRGDLICGQSAEGHVHTEECYQEREKLVCPIVADHHHDESCYDENGIVACGMEEGDGHIHGAECYETTRELVCGYGDAAHEHTDDCYTWIMEPTCGFSTESTEPELICGKEEVLLHEHTDTCFDTDGSVICGQTQVLEHVHTDDCFQVVEPADTKMLICDMKEHKHTEECYGGSSSESESGDGSEDTGIATEPAEESETVAAAGEPETELIGGADTEGKSETALTGDVETEEKPETASTGDTETEDKPETDPAGDTETEEETETDGVVEETEDTTESESESETEGVTESESETDGVIEDTENTVELSENMAGLGNLASMSGVSVPASSGLSLLHRSMIDAFRDGVDNPDTTLDETVGDNSNLYRQYLDVTGAAEPMDVLFVVDCSADTDESVNAAETYLTGDDGLIADILAQNAENRVAVYAANGTAAGAENLSQASVATPDSETAPDPVAAPDSETAPDLVAAPDPAVVSDLTVSPDSETTPDLAATPDSETSLDPAVSSEPVTSPAPAAAPETDASLNRAYGVVLVDWTAERPSEELSLAEVKEEREQASEGSAAIGRAEELFLAEAVKGNGHKKVVVFLDSDAFADAGSEDRVDNVSYISASTGDKESAIGQLKDLSMPEAVSITDQLSVYTNLCEGQIDYRVTMEDTGGVATVLYESGAVTDAGNGIMKEVIFDEETRTVSAVFCEDYRLQPGCRYTLSFNTTISGEAYEEYYESGYPSQGDADTDYAENQTSSGQMGFYVDDEACVSYQVGGVLYSETYAKPIMQISEMAMMMADDGYRSSVGTDYSDATLDHKKTIDAFREGEDNPDTTLDDPLNTLDDKTESNLHRLYLDVTTPAKQTKGTDLLLVLDNSSSMFVLDADGDREGTIGFDKNKRRNNVMKAALNQFIPDFLDSNTENRISMIYFSGAAYNWDNGLTPENTPDLDKNLPNNKGQTDSTVGDLEDDAWVVPCGWTKSASEATGSLIDVSRNKENYGKGGAGTNYAAALEEAEAWLKEYQQKMADPNHNVVMVFLSDGIPTHYIRSDGYRGGNGLSSENASKALDRTNWDNGRYNEDKICKLPTLAAIERFQTRHPNLPISSISFCTREPDEDGFDYNYALSAMPWYGGDIWSADTTDELVEALESALIVPVSDVSITDKLSTYVDLYTTQPDYKVTMKNVSDGTVKVLYENGKITDDGKGVLKSVGRDENDPSGKTVSAVFAEGYTMETGWTYTLSFNVIASQEAHDEFKENKEKGNKPYGGTTGDGETDYPGNATSSLKEGFHSNETATLQYKVPGREEPKTDFYDHPVIQVRDKSLKVKKQWFCQDGTTITDITNKRDGSISFTLIQTSKQVLPTVAPEGDPVNVKVYSKYTTGWGMWAKEKKDLISGDRLVNSGREVTITFRSPSGGKNLQWAEVGSDKILKTAMTQNGSEFSFTFTVTGDTDVYILEQGVSSYVLESQPHTTGWSLQEVGEEREYDTYTIESSKGWEIDIPNLPASGTIYNDNGDAVRDVVYTYRVVEEPNSSYKTDYVTGDGEITIQNTVFGYELPDTGGSGTTTLYTIGGLLTAFASLLLLYNNRKCRKEGFASFGAQQFRKNI